MKLNKNIFTHKKRQIMLAKLKELDQKTFRMPKKYKDCSVKLNKLQLMLNYNNKKLKRYAKENKLMMLMLQQLNYRIMQIKLLKLKQIGWQGKLQLQRNNWKTRIKMQILQKIKARKMNFNWIQKDLLSWINWL